MSRICMCHSNFYLLANLDSITISLTNPSSAKCAFAFFVLCYEQSIKGYWLLQVKHICRSSPFRITRNLLPSLLTQATPGQIGGTGRATSAPTMCLMLLILLELQSYAFSEGAASRPKTTPYCCRSAPALAHCLSAA